MRTCSVEGCNGKHVGKGYCKRHYDQFKKYGHVLERTMYDANEIIEYEDHAEMVLYNRKGDEVARTLIDLECIEAVRKHKWCLAGEYVICRKIKKRLHRFIMDCPDNLVVDHINHNKLDNRRENLRICTSQENSCNQSIRCNNTSGITGVRWHKEKNKWQANIQVDKKLKHLGYFNTKEEAIEARRQAEIEYYGEFAPTKLD